MTWEGRGKKEGRSFLPTLWGGEREVPGVFECPAVLFDTGCVLSCARNLKLLEKKV